MNALTRPAYRLDRTTHVIGNDIWGRPACAVLLPHDAPGIWVDIGGDEPILVTADRLKRSVRSLDFVYDAITIPVFEHIGAMRVWVNGFTIRTDNWQLPYDGSAKIFLDAMTANSGVVEEGNLLPFYLPKGGITASDGQERYVHAQYKGDETELEISVAVKYPRQLGEAERHRIEGKTTWQFSRADFPHIASARSLGYPPLLKPISALASQLGWPHHNHLAWPHWRMGETALANLVDEVLRHRILDLLGCLASAIPPGYYPVGSITSHRGGHALDLDLAQQLQRHAEKSGHGW